MICSDYNHIIKTKFYCDSLQLIHSIISVPLVPLCAMDYRTGYYQLVSVSLDREYCRLIYSLVPFYKLFGKFELVQLYEVVTEKKFKSNFILYVFHEYRQAAHTIDQVSAFNVLHIM